MNPIPQFIEWLELAKATKAITEPTAMALATATADSAPSVRMVLLKSVDDRGFVFYTNLESRKSGEIKQNPKVALCFYWMALERQVRVEGAIQPVSDEEADVYFASRPRDSQIGAWSSQQSRELAGKGDLAIAIAKNTAKFIGRTVPRPPFWSGWRVVPQRIEFWQQGAFRIHDREVFTRSGDDWKITKLYP
jgi:pyridoxamine 5'-phosphate oxidase